MGAIRRILISLAAFALLASPDSAAAQPDYIRLHILAASDSLFDQTLKLCIRDDVRAYAAELFDGCADADAAWQTALTHQDALLQTARNAAARYGYSGEISLETGVFPFPERTYGDEVVPAGDYRAIRIRMGAGEGRNWWCVAYPSLCLPSDADTDRPIEFYSSLWRWLVRIREAVFS